MSGWQCLYRIEDCILAVEGVDPALRVWAESLYPCIRCEQGEVQRHFTVFSEGELFGLREGNTVIAVGDLGELFCAAEWHLTQTFMQGLSRFYLLHAAVVAVAGRALVLCGASDSGKTSLAVGLGLRGAEVYGDEIAPFAVDSLRVHAFARDLVVHAGTLRLFPQMEAKLNLPVWKITDEYRFVPPQHWCAEAGPPVPCAALLFPVLCTGAEPQLRRLGQAEVAERLLEQSFNSVGWFKRGLDVVGQIVERHPAWELVFGDASQAAAHVLNLEVGQ